MLRFSHDYIYPYDDNKYLWKSIKSANKCISMSIDY